MDNPFEAAERAAIARQQQEALDAEKEAYLTMPERNNQPKRRTWGSIFRSSSGSEDSYRGQRKGGKGMSKKMLALIIFAVIAVIVIVIAVPVSVTKNKDNDDTGPNGMQNLPVVSFGYQFGDFGNDFDTTIDLPNINSIGDGHYSVPKWKSVAKSLKPTLPSISLPKPTLPSISVPSLSAPSISVPSLSVPSLSMPSISLPNVGGSRPAGSASPSPTPAPTPSTETSQADGRTVAIVKSDGKESTLTYDAGARTRFAETYAGSAPESVVTVTKPITVQDAQTVTFTAQAPETTVDGTSYPKSTVTITSVLPAQTAAQADGRKGAAAGGDVTTISTTSTETETMTTQLTEFYYYHTTVDGKESTVISTTPVQTTITTEIPHPTGIVSTIPAPTPTQTTVVTSTEIDHTTTTDIVSSTTVIDQTSIVDETSIVDKTNTVPAGPQTYTLTVPDVHTVTIPTLLTRSTTTGSVRLVSPTTRMETFTVTYTPSAQNAQPLATTAPAQNATEATVTAQASTNSASAASTVVPTVTAAAGATNQTGAANQTGDARAQGASGNTRVVPIGSKVYQGGYGTWFTQNNTAGACGAVHQDSDVVFALDSRSYKQELCGKTMVVTRLSSGRSVLGKIADECPTCNSAHSVDMSLGAFKKLGTLEEGMFPISFFFVDSIDPKSLPA